MNGQVSQGGPRAGGRVFASRFSPEPAKRFVGFGLLLFAGAFALGLWIGGGVPVSPVVFSAVLVFHFWPALSPVRPALQFEDDGFWIDGLGLVPWEAVSSARWVAVPRQRGPALRMLEISLAAPLSMVVVRPSPGGWLRRLQTRNWRRIEPTRLLILCSGLEDPPEAVRDAFEAFLGKPLSGIRGLVA